MIAAIQLTPKHQISADLSKGTPISLPIVHGQSNPNCYWAEPPSFETITSEGFIGSVSDGGPVNYQSLKMTPHGNGTHTECYGHITDSGATIFQSLKDYFFLAQLITVTPVEKTDGDLVVPAEAINMLDLNSPINGLIIRTLPNDQSKLTRQYSGTNPPYLDSQIGRLLYDRGIAHLLVDLPSVDKEIDQGALVTHRAFWGIDRKIRKKATITELVFVQNIIKDGLYLVNLQIVPIEMDATPSNPILYPILNF